MSNVINFAQKLHERRVNAAMAASEAAEAERLGKRRAALRAEYEDAGRSGVLFADIVADVVEAKEREEKAAEPYRPMPAYCDPENEARGPKHDATRNESLTDLAKRMRADIKAAIARKQIPTGFKVSVTTRYYSGGGAIDMRVTAFPAGFTVNNPAWLRHEEEHKHGVWVHFHGEADSPEWAAVRAVLKSIHSAYNRDNSDAMTDYFDVRYYGDVGIDWRISSDIRKAELASALAAQEA